MVKKILLLSLFCYTQISNACIKCDDFSCAKRTCAGATVCGAAGAFGIYLLPATLGKYLIGVGCGLSVPSTVTAAYCCCRPARENSLIDTQPTNHNNYQSIQ